MKSPGNQQTIYSFLLLLFRSFNFFKILYMHYILTKFCLLHPPSGPPSILSPLDPLFLSQRESAGIPGLSTEHSITNYNKLGTNPPINVEQGKPIGGKGSQAQAKSEIPPPKTHTVSHKTTKLRNQKAYKHAQTHAGCL